MLGLLAALSDVGSGPAKTRWVELAPTVSGGRLTSLGRSKKFVVMSHGLTSYLIDRDTIRPLQVEVNHRSGFVLPWGEGVFVAIVGDRVAVGGQSDIDAAECSSNGCRLRVHLWPTIPVSAAKQFRSRVVRANARASAESWDSEWHRRGSLIAVTQTWRQLGASARAAALEAMALPSAVASVVEGRLWISESPSRGLLCDSSGCAQYLGPVGASSMRWCGDAPVAFMLRDERSSESGSWNGRTVTLPSSDAHVVSCDGENALFVSTAGVEDTWGIVSIASGRLRRVGAVPDAEFPGWGGLLAGECVYLSGPWPLRGGASVSCTDQLDGRR